MGNVLQKPATDAEKLDRLITSISHLEAFHLQLEEKKNLWVENMITYGTGLYLLMGGVMYVFRSTGSRAKRNFYVIGYALLPILLILLKELMMWVFNLRLEQTEFQLKNLKIEREEMIGMMMQTDRSRPLKKSLSSSPGKTALVKSAGKLSDPPQKGFLDRLYEFMAGEGSHNRYALICSRCRYHNGMALQEEFPFIAFQCYHCYYMNPARKTRPVSPKLDYGPLYPSGKDICVDPVKKNPTPVPVRYKGLTS